MQRGGALVGFVAVAVLVVWLIPELYQLFFSSHPVVDGTRMVYRMEESDGKGNEVSYGVVLTFEAKEQGSFRLVVNSPHGVRKLKVFEDSLAPTADRDNDAFEFPTRGGMKVGPQMLWLPPDRRVPGKNCLTGLVMGIEGFSGLRAWQVMHPDGMVYFDEETGLLAGFELEYALTKVTGRLRSIR